MVTWPPSIYPSHVSINLPYMDPSWVCFKDSPFVPSHGFAWNEPAMEELVPWKHRSHYVEVPWGPISKWRLATSLLWLVVGPATPLKNMTEFVHLGWWHNPNMNGNMPKMATSYHQHISLIESWWIMYPLVNTHKNYMEQLHILNGHINELSMASSSPEAIPYYPIRTILITSTAGGDWWLLQVVKFWWIQGTLPSGDFIYIYIYTHPHS